MQKETDLHLGVTHKIVEAIWLLSCEERKEGTYVWGYKKSYPLFSLSMLGFLGIHLVLYNYKIAFLPLRTQSPQCVCWGWGRSSFPPTDEKGITGPFQVLEKQSSSPQSVLARPEETAQWPFLVISSLFSQIEPDSLSFLKRASDTVCTLWSCAGTSWSSSDCGWQFWESGMFSSAWGHTSGPSRCLGHHFWSSINWVASGAARSICRSFSFSQFLLGWSSSQAGSPSRQEAALWWGSSGRDAAARCFHRGQCLQEPKRCSHQSSSSNTSGRHAHTIHDYILCEQLFLIKVILLYGIIGNQTIYLKYPTTVLWEASATNNRKLWTDHLQFSQ